jgi:hypothetical protein
MAWLSNFLLGRPGLEISFDLNPSSMKISDSQIMAANRTLSGRRKKWVFCTSIPSITIDSKWLLLADRNALESLLSITDTPLSFKVRSGDFQMINEINVPISTINVTIQQNSATRLSQALVQQGYPSVITVTGVFLNANGTGTNYFNSGAYNDLNFLVTLGTALPGTTQSVYVTYNYSGWLVHMDKMPYNISGGWIDKFEYSGFSLEGA